MKTNVLFHLHIAPRPPERVVLRLSWSLAASATGRPTLRASWDARGSVADSSAPPTRAGAAEGVAA
jgi:hypothetical protein